MKHDQLMEQYEDTLFALLMESIAESEGQKELLRNEELADSSEFEVPDSADRQMEEMIRKAVEKKHRTRKLQFIRPAAKRIALIAATAALMFTVAYASVEEFRVFTLNTIIEVFDSYTRISFTGDSMTDEYSNQHYGITVDWLPEHYTIFAGWDNPGHTFAAFKDDVGSVIEINVDTYSSAIVYNVDTEACTKKDLTMHGFPASIYVKDPEVVRARYVDNPHITSEMTIIWIDEINRIITMIHATNLTEEEMIRIAEGIH